tara:strand:- start:792 stop:950 length:159 start_codon:yes stop_codon:yes gene_type:complete
MWIPLVEKYLPIYDFCIYLLHVYTRETKWGYGENVVTNKFDSLSKPNAGAML